MKAKEETPKYINSTIKRLGFIRRFIHYFLLMLARLIFVFIPYEVEGKNNIPSEGIGTLFVSNHLSFIDPVFTAVAAFPQKRAIRFAGAKDIMKRWYFRWSKYELAFPVGRGAGEREKFIQNAVILLENGESVGIYPEGRRSLMKQLENVKIGAGWIAKHAGSTIKVIPVYITGTDHLMPLGGFLRLSFMRKLKIRFGSPVDLSDYYLLPDSPKTSKVITEKIVENIKLMKKIE
ncbi:MAG: lysophospholipid acyltransferase family protein [Promethearchaeota archaeon]